MFKSAGIPKMIDVAIQVLEAVPAGVAANIITGWLMRAWFKTCHFQVTPEIDRALMVKGFLVLGVTLI